jgi:hypothetical protein
MPTTVCLNRLHLLIRRLDLADRFLLRLQAASTS